MLQCIAITASFMLSASPNVATDPPPADDQAPHVVLIAGDEEYRSEESLPMLASMLRRDHGFRTTVLFSLDEEGRIDPERLDHIPGTEVLDDADLRCAVSDSNVAQLILSKISRPCCVWTSPLILNSKYLNKTFLHEVLGPN